MAWAELINDHDAYARALTAYVFADPAAQQFFTESRAIALSQSAPLRVRIDADNDLHALRWELLRDPTDLSRSLSDVLC